jgi:hypothetical protein
LYENRDPVRCDFLVAKITYLLQQSQGRGRDRLLGQLDYPTIGPMGRKPRKPKPRLGRPPKPVAEQKSDRFFFAAGPDAARLYRRIVSERFNGNFSDFARAACEAFAAQLGYEKTTEQQEREAVDLEAARFSWLERAAAAAGESDVRTWLEKIAATTGAKLLGEPIPKAPEAPDKKSR